jgi:hypothetical protein
MPDKDNPRARPKGPAGPIVERHLAGHNKGPAREGEDKAQTEIWDLQWEAGQNFCPRRESSLLQAGWSEGPLATRQRSAAPPMMRSPAQWAR